MARNAASLLDRGWDLLESGHADEAAEQARQALTATDDRLRAEANLLLAQVALVADETETAEKHLRQAIALDGHDFEARLALGELVGGEAPKEAAKLAREALERIPAATEHDAARLDATLLLVDALLSEEKVRPAQKALRELDASCGERLARDHDASVDLAHAWLDLKDVERAEHYARAAVTVDAASGDAHHMLAIVLEHKGDRRAMIESFRRVHELDARAERPPFALSADRFEQVAERALGELPPSIREKLGSVPVVVADYPSLELVLEGSDPRMMGFFSGVPYPEQGSQTIPHLECIFLYQRNIERDCEDAEQIEAEIRTTVLHECGHFLGFDEDDLDELGLA